MPTVIDLEMPPAGYAISGARAGEQASIQCMEFTSTEDGQHFIQRLEGLPSEILGKLTPPIRPSQVESLLAILDRDGKATVYVNEVGQKVRMRPSRSIKAGERVSKNDIVDLDRLELSVDVPAEAGVLYVFSEGWRKGLFYDFGPIAGPDPKPRDYDLFSLLGQVYCQVLFQERFSITESEWEALFKAKWFPFAALPHGTIDELISYIRCGWDPDEKLDEVALEVKGRLPELLKVWSKHPALAPHFEILERAVERFQQDDFLSCTSLLFPRIEGILRTHHASLGTVEKPTQTNLSNSAVSERLDRTACLLLPHWFAKYLQTVYFADFNPVAQSIDVSRHSVSHGVATTSQFNKKSSLIGLLVVHQLYYCMDVKRIQNHLAKLPGNSPAIEAPPKIGENRERDAG
ncbi:MAG: hypothetical protein ACR2FY_15395 [Pirellulaceae bacterium]